MKKILISILVSAFCLNTATASKESDFWEKLKNANNTKPSGLKNTWNKNNTNKQKKNKGKER